MKQVVSIFWFRRDLRLDDNTALSDALTGENPVLPVFIFDPALLDQLPANDARLTFIYDTVAALRKELQQKHASSLAMFFGPPLEVFQHLCERYDLTEVYANHDYEPYARRRDREIASYLETNTIPFRTCKDQVLFEKEEVTNQHGRPYLVYGPYMRKWKEAFRKGRYPDGAGEEPDRANFLHNKRLPVVTLRDMGFERSTIRVASYRFSPALLEHYKDTRDFPALDHGTSRLGPHLRFGTVSIRKVAGRASLDATGTFLDELIWREFFMQLLWHFPESGQKALKPQYDRIRWRNDEREFEKWKNGQTGFAIVDAGMRQLNASGYMHNRVRMITAGFLCRQLLIDWRRGEAYFAEKLLDYEMSSNVGNWQWAAGCGADAAPYFRIFNPLTQAEKFDPDLTYIKKWVPEYGTSGYPGMMVDLTEARERCIKAYKKALG